MSLSLKSKKAVILDGSDAHWYETPSGIDIYIYSAGAARTLSCHIKRSELVKYIKRSEKKA